MQAMVDLAIVGAGIVGTNLAYLAKQYYPHWQIALFEQQQTTRGASFYSAGLDTPLARGPWHAQLTWRGRALYQYYHADIKAKHCTTVQTLWIVKHAQINNFKNNIIDGRLTLLKGKQQIFYQNKYGIILADDEVIFLHDGISYGNVDNIINAIRAKTFNNKQCHYYNNCAVNTIKSLDQRYLLLNLANGNHIITRHLLSATGAWHQCLFASLTEKVSSKKVAALHLDIKPVADDQLIFFYDTGYFLLPLWQQGYWLLSFPSTHHPSFSADIPVITHREKQVAIKFLQQHMPAFNRPIIGTRAFSDSYTANRVPIVMRNPALKNHIAIAGASGSGYRLAPALAEVALQFLGGA